MRIERITDLNEILKCVPYEQDIRSKGRDISSISTMLLSISELILNPLFGYWIAYEGDEIVGYMSAIASRQKNLKRILLLRLYGKSKEIRNAFDKVLEDFGREFKIKPEWEVWHTGSYYNLNYIIKKQEIIPPHVLTLFFNWPGGTWSPPTADEYLHRIKYMPGHSVHPYPPHQLPSPYRHG